MKGHCYHLSKGTNCSPGICDGLMSWQPRCTTNASSGTRHVVMYLSLRLVTAPVTQSGSVSLTMHALSMTHVSALVPVASPQLSPLVCCYLPTLSSPCTL